MRGVLPRSLAVLGVGLAVLAGILYVASTVDARPPAVDRIGLTQHLSGDESVALTTTSVEVEFSEPVQEDTAETAFRLEPQVAGAFTWSGSTLLFTPTDRLPLETDFRVAVAAGVRDEAGNTMAEASAAFEFTTVGEPTVVATEPEEGAEEVPLDATIVIEFSTLMDTASVEGALRIAPALEVQAAWSGERLTLTPVEPLAEGRDYTLRIGITASDSAGIPLERPFRLTFRAALSDLEATVLVPADGVEGVAVTSPIAIVMDREIDPESVDGELLTVEPAVAGSLEVVAAPGAAGLRDPGGRVLVFRPSDSMQANTTYEVSLAPGLAGTDGSRLASPLAWRFTTGSPLATLSNQVVFLSERAGIANLWTMNPDGTGQRQVTAELSPVSAYAVAPDGRSVVVGDGAILVQQDADGSDRRVLTPDGVLEFDPTWSPDGSRLAFGRAEGGSGAGLGLWSRAADGGEATRLQLPDQLRPDATARPSASPQDPSPAPILRAPRYSPDGAALAFVDGSGHVGVLELPGGRVTTASFVATAPPSWLPDSTGILISGLYSIPNPPEASGEPMAPLDPADMELTRIQLASLSLVRMDRGAARVEPLSPGSGSGRPVAGANGEYLFVAIDPDAAAASGELRLMTRAGAAVALLDDDGAPVSSAAFGVEPQTVVAARAADPDDPEGGPEAGIWLVDVTAGRGEQLSADGWLPRWLP